MDAALVTKVWHDNRAVLLRKCLGWSRGNLGEAEDLLSDAYLRGFESVRVMQSEVLSPFGWWVAIIANLARDRRRRLRRRPFSDVSAGVVEQVVDQTPGAEQVSVAREHLVRALDGLQHLTNLQRTALAGRGAGVEYWELARELGTTSANVRKLVQSAREALRKQAT